jgi:hypothetical protein
VTEVTFMAKKVFGSWLFTFILIYLSHEWNEPLVDTYFVRCWKD